MMLSDPLATLVSHAQADALEALARSDSGMTGRQVARVAGVQHHTGIKRALDRLEHLGLVTVERGLQHSSYRVNRDHLLWPAIELALASRSELERRIRATISGSLVPVVSVALFGSTARGTATDESDVDLVVVYEGDPDPKLSGHLGDSVTRWTGNPCQVFDLSRAELEQSVASDDPIVHSWRADARTLHGEDLRSLL